MNQFSSDQPSARTSCGGARSLQGEACSLSPPSPVFELDSRPGGDTGCPPGRDPGPRAACCPGPPSHCVSGAVGGGAPVVCPMVQARSRGKAVACEPKGKGRPNPSLIPLPDGRSAVPSAPPLTPGPRGWLRLWRELRPLSWLGWHRGRPSRSPRPTPPAGPEHLPPAPPAGPRSRLLPRGARQLSRAPRGPRQAGNLLLFVECFCHANPRAGRWR